MSDSVEPASPPSPPAKARPGTAWLVFSTALIGALVAPVALVLLFGVMVAADPSCHGGGSNGGCSMGVFAGGIAGVPIGFVLGLVAGLVRALMRATPKNPG
ncbi:MAG TPA: hypothetical protein VE914_03520 [Candidatus Angelobacter sp.]|nr:hypothetical protein [Candidatus Angelobacter sp.]